MFSGRQITWDMFPKGTYATKSSGVLSCQPTYKSWTERESYDTAFPRIKRRARTGGGSVRHQAEETLRRGDIGSPWYSENHFHVSDRSIVNRGWDNSVEDLVRSQWATGVNTLATRPKIVHDQVTNAIGVDPFSATFRKRAEALGASAIARGLPYDDVFNVITTVGELVPRGPGSSLEVPRIPASQLRAALRAPSDRPVRDVLGAAGSEWLNLQFGVLPLIGDLQNLVKAMAVSSAELETFHQRKGKSFPFGETTLDETKAIDISLWSPPDGMTSTADYYGSFAVRVTGIATYRSRTSGLFTYTGVPSGDSFTRAVEQANYLFGVSPDIGDAWELTPFSWLVDWSTNTGDVLKTISRLGRDGLVLTRAYTTYKVDYDVEVKADMRLTRDGSNSPIWHRQQGSAKHRIRANPFGFGVTGEALTDFRVSILAALGLTALRR